MSAKVVIVEDDQDIRLLAAKRLAAAGYQVLTAEDGVVGLELIQRERPDVVVLDLMMPRLHGFGVLQQIRADLALRDTAVIITSAKAYAIDVAKAKELGANDYLTKPYEFEELTRKVDCLLAPGAPIRIKFWGTRGSIPTPGACTARYGGNTPCVEVGFDDQIVMFDSGSGAREMGLALMKERGGKPLDIHLFISHTHWDHIQGFPFFAPAYIPGNRITIYSLRSTDKSLEKVFTGQMDASYFPVSMTDLKAYFRFVELDGPVTIGNARISYAHLNHPGIAIGFRIDSAGHSVAYLSDHEPYCRLSGRNAHNEKLDAELTDFARGCDLYIREAQYTEEEYRSKRGWGHSVTTDALDSAAAAQVRSLALFHHDPMHDDATMESIVESCLQYAKEKEMGFEFFAARDNLELSV